nr:hypothetical protein [Actinomadura madurae]
MSSRPNSPGGAVGQPGGGVRIAEVGGHDERAAPGRLDLSGHLAQLLLGPGGDHHVGAGLGERHRGGRADAAPGAGHHRDPALDAEPVPDHRVTSGPSRHCPHSLRRM